MSDEGAVQILEAVVLGVVFFTAMALVTFNTAPDVGDTNAKQAYADKEKQTEQIVIVGEHWCCPADPSASSLLQDSAIQAWAGDPDPLLDLFKPWFPEPESTDFAVKATWAPPGGSATHTIDVYNSSTPHGKTAGTQMPTRPADQGPAYVVPRLDKFSAESSADILTVPIHNVWPYRTDSFGAHEDHIETEITYERSYPDTDDTRTVTVEGHTEVAGSPNPAVDLHFREPDWQELEASIDTELIDYNYSTETKDRAFTQVLTKDDLASEKTLHQNEDNLLDDAETLDDDTYPHHPFHVQANIHGPGAIQAANHRTADEGQTREITDAYKLTIHVPRNWTDVNITPKPGDAKSNDEHNWTNTSIEPLDEGGHRITSYLNLTAEFNVTDRGPRWVLTNAKEIQAPFRFHARPPDDTASTELGFHDLQATLESQRFHARETATLTVEVATSPGRVHRSLATHTPHIIPDTNTTHHEDPPGVDLTLGAVLKNGGEATNVTKITWTIPQHTTPKTRDLRPIEDFTGGGNWTVTQTDEELKIIWEANASLVDTTCGQLEACPVAARLTLDGGGLTQRPLWAPPQLLTLYDEQDAQPFLDWFVRTDRAWEGLPRHRDRPPGFALAHRYQQANAGPTEGAYRFTVPPTLTPACNEQDITRRNTADRDREDGRVYYDFGPREDGLPHVAHDQGLETTLFDTDVTCSIGDRNFTTIGKMGLEETTDAIGKNTYRSVPGLSGQTVADWQNGLAESRLSAPEEVEVGQSTTTTVDVRSLMTTLFLDDEVTDVTIERMVYDPYNAWEAQPWHQDWIWRPGSDTATDTDAGLDETEGDNDGGQDLIADSCEGKQTECFEVDHEWAPSQLTPKLDVPEDGVPGTHLLVVEVHWTFTTPEGNDITETGRLIEPLDVLSADGDHVQGAAIGVTAWDTDWR